LSFHTIPVTGFKTVNNQCWVDNLQVVQQVEHVPNKPAVNKPEQSKVKRNTKVVTDGFNLEVAFRDSWIQ
jgi:hypothetical protein